MSFTYSTYILSRRAYKLASDEVVLFEYFCITQEHFMREGIKDFYSSMKRIEKEFNIGRRRQEAIIKLLSEIGVLSVETRPNKEKSTRSKYFHIDFDQLSKATTLANIIDSSTDYFNEAIAHFKELVSVQKGLSKPKKKAAKSTVNVDVIFVKLQDTFRERVRMYNDGELTKEKPKRTKAASFLPRNKQIETILSQAKGSYSDTAINSAFMVYIDDILCGRANAPRKTLENFLSYDVEKGCYPVIDFNLEKFNKEYGRPNQE